MRAVLIVNPNATSTTPATRDLLAHALESRVKLTVIHTDHRGHAVEIGRDAAADGVDVLIVHGGDGTVNEVVNGILEAGGPRRGDACGRRRARRLGQRLRPRAGDQPGPDRGDQPAHRPVVRLPAAQDLAAHRADGLRRTLGGVHRGHGRGRRRRRRRRGPARQGPQGHGLALYPRGHPRNAGQRPQGSRADAAHARSRTRRRRAFRLRVELQPLDLCQRQARVDQSDDHLRDRPRRLRRSPA